VVVITCFWKHISEGVQLELSLNLKDVSSLPITDGTTESAYLLIRYRKIKSSLKEKVYMRHGTRLYLSFALLVIAFTATVPSAKSQWVKTDIPKNGATGAFVASSTKLFAGVSTDGFYSDGAVFVSTNNGASWSSTSTITWGVTALAASGTSLYGATIRPDGFRPGGVYRSSNDAASWTGVGLTSYDVVTLAVLGTNIFAGTLGQGVFWSTDNGATWIERYQFGATWFFCSNVNGTSIFAGTDNGIYRTTNNGVSWTNIGLTTSDVTAINFIGSTIFVGTLNGIFRSTNTGGVWTSSGLDGNVLTSLQVSGSNIFAGTSAGVFMSTNGGVSWASVNTGLTNTDIKSLIISGSYLLAGTGGFGVNANVWRRPLSQMLPPTNVPPVAVNDVASTKEGVSVTINVTANDHDSEGPINAASVDLNTSVGGVQSSITNLEGTWVADGVGNVTYTPAANFTGIATLPYTVNDNNGATSNVATITVTVQSKYGTTVLAHGYCGLGLTMSPPYISVCTNYPEWLNTMANAIARRIGKGQVYLLSDGQLTPMPELSVGSGGENIVIFDWHTESSIDVFGYAEAAGDALAAMLLKYARSPNAIWSLNQLHFIGHSRGTIVLSEAVERLGLYAKTPGMLPSGLVIDQKIHYTALDAHAWHDDSRYPDPDCEPFTADDYYVNSDNLGSAMAAWQNVAYADNYFHESNPNAACFHVADVIDLDGLENIPGCGVKMNLTERDGRYTGMYHGGPIDWYIGTIDPNYAGMGANGNTVWPTWFQPGERTTLGFNYSVSAGGDPSLIASVGPRNISNDNTLSRNKIINGDLYMGRSYLEQDDELPGWQYEGGGGNAKRVETEDITGLPYLKLTNSWPGGILTGYERVHNPIFVPNDVDKIWFELAVFEPSEDQNLRVIINDGTADYNQATFPLLEPELADGQSPFIKKSVDVTAFRGSVITPKFILNPLPSSPLDFRGASIGITSLGFSKPEQWVATVVAEGFDNPILKGSEVISSSATPVELHAYDSNGNHTGPTSDSTWEELIPGSKYKAQSDTLPYPRKTIILPKAASGATYYYEIVSGIGTAPFSFQINNGTEGDETFISRFDSISVGPMTTAICSLLAGQFPLLQIDVDGNGTIDSVMATSPHAPDLVFPVNAATNQSTSPILTWRRTNASLYRLQLSTDSTFVAGAIVYDSMMIDTSVTISNLANVTKYYWRVSGRNGGRESRWSTKSSFATLSEVVENIDQSQNGIDNGVWCETYLVRWQEFRPTVPLLSKIDLLIYRIGNSGNLIISLTDSLGVTLKTIVIPQTEMISGINWLTVVLDTTVVLIPEKKYRINLVAQSNRQDVSNGVAWYGLLNSSYTRGMSSLSSVPSAANFDFGFRTYYTVNNNKYALTSTSTHGLITKLPDQALYDHASTVQLTASPSIGYEFAGWTGSVTGMTNPLTIVMDGSKIISANFLRVPISIDIPMIAGWNIVSLPVLSADVHPSSLFPFATTPAYTFSDGYVQCDSLAVGVGYWLKYPAVGSSHTNGQPIDAAIVNVHQGWNMIGSISTSLPVANIASQPPGLITSSFFRYGSSYEIAQTLEPGSGYWVKVASPGSLTLSPSYAGRSSALIQVVPTEELPPPPPVINSEDQILPTQYSLAQNYPNPFNPGTMIHYEIPSASKVSLKIFNVVGQLVKVLLDEEKPAGVYDVAWDASKFPSGVYFYRLQAGSFVETKKLVLMK
jgi:hypothetical protein